MNEVPSAAGGRATTSGTCASTLQQQKFADGSDAVRGEEVCEEQGARCLSPDGTAPAGPPAGAPSRESVPALEPCRRRDTPRSCRTCATRFDRLGRADGEP